MTAVMPTVPHLSRAAKTATDRHEVMNTVMHSALRRDISRAAQLLASGPDARHRRALAAHLHFMLDQLHHHHTVEDDLIWPAVLAKRPDLTELVDAMEAEHEDLVEACHQLRDAATAWSYDGAENRRAATASALYRLSTTLEKHLAHEEDEAMPLVCSVLTPAEWKPIEKGIGRSQGGLAEQARTFFWIMDSLDARRSKLVLSSIPKLAVMFLRMRFERRETERATQLWG
jgi:hemerythrin-like domain-containing protein